MRAQSAKLLVMLCLGMRMNMYVRTHAGCNQEIYVADSSNNRVQVFSNNGTFLRSFGILGVRPGELDQPEDVAVDAARGRVAVAETGKSLGCHVEKVLGR